MADVDEPLAEGGGDNDDQQVDDVADEGGPFDCPFCVMRFTSEVGVNLHITRGCTWLVQW